MQQARMQQVCPDTVSKLDASLDNAAVDSESRIMSKRRLIICAFALVGALIGVVLGVSAAPGNTRYQISANVALVPPPNLSTVEASGFWEVLTRGQVSRTAAILYSDPRWIPSAANAAKADPGDLYVEATALPETTMMTVSVSASSAQAAEAALNDILTTATPDVASLAAPYFVKVLWPQKGSAVVLPAPGKTTFGGAGFLGGLLVGGGIGVFAPRFRRFREVLGEQPAERMDEATLHR